MKKILLVIFIVGLLTPSTSIAFNSVGDLSGAINLNGYRTTDPNAESRINLVPHIRYDRVFFRGDYMFDFNDNKELTKYQQKSTVGIDILYGMSMRYQYDNFYSEKISVKSLKGVTINTTKITSWYESRYGVGEYFKLPPVMGATLSNDLAVFKEERNDFRVEDNVVLNHPLFLIRNQVYHDFTDGDMVKYFDKISISYKITPKFYITSQCQWQSSSDRIDRLGITIVY